MSPRGALCLLLFCRLRARAVASFAVQVEIRHEGGTDMLEVGDGESILEAAIDHGLAMSHDCKMGVCMTCPARLVR